MGSIADMEKVLMERLRKGPPKTPEEWDELWHCVGILHSMKGLMERPPNSLVDAYKRAYKAHQESLLEKKKGN